LKKFILGLFCGIVVSVSTVAVASDTTIQAYLFPSHFYINGEIKLLDQENPVLNYNGHAYVPVRYVAENMGGYVDFDNSNNGITINYFPVDKPFLTDPQYPNIHFGLIDVYLDGGYTGIRGLLSVDNLIDSTVKTEHDIQFSLDFYDANEKLIGTALGSTAANSDQKQTISTGEIKNVNAGAVGDFSRYTKVTLKVISFQ
jgi:hypothetical protein